MSARRILLWVSQSYPHGRDILRGALHFTRRRDDWEVLRRPANRRIPDRSLVTDVDGIIAFINNESAARVFTRATCPVVNVAASLSDRRWPTVANDDAAIGRLAAEHFLDRGFRSFAYIALRGEFAPRLEAGFAQRLAANGLRYCRFLHGSASAPSHPHLATPTATLVQWVGQLPPSTAVFTVVDAVGAAVASACRRLKRHVPEDLAILGVNDDELTCESVEPPLSSIQTAGEQIGMRATMLLADLLAGATAPTRPVWIQPPGVVTRSSTDTMCTRDPVVGKAIQYIRQNVARPTTVDDVLDALVVSRKSLERKFRQQLGRTPLSEIRRVHLQHVQDLLIHTDCAVGDIARRSGFARPQHMATLFHRLVGQTPSAYRQQFRCR